MISRQELKSRGKAAFMRNYWQCVLVALILGIIISLSTGGGSGADHGYDAQVESQTNVPVLDDITDAQQQLPAPYRNAISNFAANSNFGYLPTLAVVGLSIAGIVGFLLHLFVFNVVEVGGCDFFVQNAQARDEKVTVGTIVSGFQGGNYGTVVLTQFLRGLFITLWSLLFIIPGIIKSYEYMMVPYILADEPGVTWREAFAMSKEMMRGNKMSAFILHLSFIGWEILNILTMGILGVFFVDPYVRATEAELYLALRPPKTTYSQDDYSQTGYTGSDHTQWQ